MGSPSAVERLCHSSYLGGPSARTYSHRLRAARRRGRLQTQSHLLPPTTPGPKCHPGQTPLQLQGIRCTPPDAGTFPHRTVRETSLIETVFSAVKRKLSCRARQNPAHSIPPSSPARTSLQSLPPQAACYLTAGREDVNRAGWALVTSLSGCA